jgi:hypothetical protein
MKIKINYQTIKKILLIMSETTLKKMTRPILTSINIKAKKEEASGKVTFLSTDSSILSSISIDSEVIEEGTINLSCLSFHKAFSFIETISKMPYSEIKLPIETVILETAVSGNFVMLEINGVGFPIGDNISGDFPINNDPKTGMLAESVTKPESRYKIVLNNNILNQLARLASRNSGSLSVVTLMIDTYAGLKPVYFTIDSINGETDIKGIACQARTVRG